MALKLKVFGVLGGYHGPLSKYKSKNLVGYTLDDGEHLIALDAGSWKMAKDKHVCSNLDTILLSHNHMDHILHLNRLIKNAKKDVKVYSPQKFRKKNVELITDMPSSLHGYSLEYLQTTHNKKNYCYKLSKGGKTVCYTGDTGYFDGLADFCKGVDLLICELTLSDYNSIRIRIANHMTPSQAATLAEEAKPGILMLTHFKHAKPEDAIDEIKKKFKSVIAGHEGLELLV